METSDRLASFPRPEKPITLYEFEGCPFCRKVRSQQYSPPGAAEALHGMRHHR